MCRAAVVLCSSAALRRDPAAVRAAGQPPTAGTSRPCTSLTPNLAPHCSPFSLLREHRRSARPTPTTRPLGPRMPLYSALVSRPWRRRGPPLCPTQCPSLAWPLRPRLRLFHPSWPQRTRCRNSYGCNYRCCRSSRGASRRYRGSRRPKKRHSHSRPMNGSRHTHRD